MDPEETTRGYLRWWIWLTYLVLFVIGIPWYWPMGDRAMWFGVPAWVVVAVLTSVLLSVFTAWLILRRWPQDDKVESEEGSP